MKENMELCKKKIHSARNCSGICRLVGSSSTSTASRTAPAMSLVTTADDKFTAERLLHKNCTADTPPAFIPKKSYTVHGRR